MLSSSSSAYHSPLLDIGLANVSPSRSIFDYSHPAPASRPAQIVTPPGLIGMYKYKLENVGNMLTTCHVCCQLLIFGTSEYSHIMFSVL
jgi:hypothetical protein